MNNRFSAYKLFFTLIFFLLLSCKHNKTIQLEQTIYENIFDEVVESTITDYRTLVVPSPSDFKSNEAVEELNRKIEEKKKTKRKTLIVGVRDTVRAVLNMESLYKKVKKNFPDSDYQSLVNNEKNKNKSPFKVNIESFNIDTTKYELVYASEIAKDEKPLDESEIDRFSGVYDLSRIYFNKEYTFGVFSLSLVYDKLNAIGVIVVLRKENNQWIVDKIIEDWIS